MKHETLLGILVYAFVLFLHNLCVLNMNLSDNVLYFRTFTFKLTKHKMATKILRKTYIFYSLSHINAQYMVSARFLMGNLFLVSLEKNVLYLSFRSKTSAVFYVFTVTISILLNMLTII